MRNDMRLDADARRHTDPSCSRCGATGFDFRWQTFANGTRHIRVDCRRCGAYVRYAPQTAENVALADAAAATPGTAS